MQAEPDDFVYPTDSRIFWQVRRGDDPGPTPGASGVVGLAGEQAKAML
jgi:hypothetical protein